MPRKEGNLSNDSPSDNMQFSESSNHFVAQEEKLLSRRTEFSPNTDLEVRSRGFKAGEWLPKRYTQDGANLSPDVIWRNIPGETEELVLICEDPYAPQKDPYVHWIVYNINPEISSLPENLRADSDYKGVLHGKNSSGSAGYIGPLPPIAHGPHFYHFQLFCLREKTNLLKGAAFNEVLNAIRNNVIAQATFIGVYERFETLC